MVWNLDHEFLLKKIEEENEVHLRDWFNLCVKCCANPNRNLADFNCLCICCCSKVGLETILNYYSSAAEMV